MVGWVAAVPTQKGTAVVVRRLVTSPDCFDQARESL